MKLSLAYSLFLCPLESMNFPKFDYCQLLEEFMHAQLANFHNTKSFKYQSYLVYLILSQNHPYFEALGIKIIDEAGELKPIIEWTHETRKQEHNIGFSLYVKGNMCVIYTILLLS
jgi:hypothetical protein